MNDRRPQPLAELLPALLCPAVEDITGTPCRRLACDGAHSSTGTDPWAPTADAWRWQQVAAAFGATTEEPA